MGNTLPKNSEEVDLLRDGIFTAFGLNSGVGYAFAVVIFTAIFFMCTFGFVATARIMVSCGIINPRRLPTAAFFTVSIILWSVYYILFWGLPSILEWVWFGILVLFMTTISSKSAALNIRRACLGQVTPGT